MALAIGIASSALLAVALAASGLALHALLAVVAVAAQAIGVATLTGLCRVVDAAFAFAGSLQQGESAERNPRN